MELDISSIDGKIDAIFIILFGVWLEVKLWSNSTDIGVWWWRI